MRDAQVRRKPNARDKIRQSGTDGIAKAEPELPKPDRELSVGSNRIFFLGERLNFVLEQAAFFQQAAEIFFAGVSVLAFAGVEIFEDFVGHFQPLEVNDADVFVAMFPNLALLEF
jgi:hypothetical protein